MSEVRLARKGETARQKEIWKLCFGDSDNYIDFFYANRHKEDETVLLLQDGEILTMLTMLPIRVVAADKRSFNSIMLYAIATHPKYQNRGLATQLMTFAYQYSENKNIVFSVLVPSEQRLFDFYRHQGYEDGFYIREAFFNRKGIDDLHSEETCQCIISSINADEYNMRRNKQLEGRLHIAYADQDVAYQKKVAQQSGSDIYGIAVGEVKGCLAIEKISTKLFIKELLVPEEYLTLAIKQISHKMPAEDYIVRTPAFLGSQLGGCIRPFGMIKANKDNKHEIVPADLGYLGLAFD